MNECDLGFLCATP